MKRTHRSFADGKGRGSTFPKTLATLALALLGFTTEAASYATDGARQWDLAESMDEKRIHLIAATRYITAQKVMKGILWSTQNAERLQRGESLSDREDQE